MRVSTNEFFRQAVQSVTLQQEALSQQQLQLASGKRILKPSDDPIGTAQVLNLTSSQEVNSQHIRNAGRAESRLAVAETTLASVTENLQRVRELTVQAANDSQTSNTRADIAEEIEQRLEELRSLANTTDANGEYIFGGTKSNTQPFVTSAGITDYSGDDGQRFVSIGGERQVAVNVPGSRVFMAAPAGNGAFTVDASGANAGTGVIGTGSLIDAKAFDGDDYTVEFTAPDQYEIRSSSGAVIATQSYTSGDSIDSIAGIEFTIQGEPETGDQFLISAAGNKSLFETYNELIDGLRQPANTAAEEAQLRTTFNKSLTGLSQALDHIIDIRSDVGGRLQTIESQVNLNQEYAVQLSTARSAIADLDITEAVSKLQQQLGALQAAQQSFVRIQGLSLFNLIN